MYTWKCVAVCACACVSVCRRTVLCAGAWWSFVRGDRAVTGGRGGRSAWKKNDGRVVEEKTQTKENVSGGAHRRDRNVTPANMPSDNNDDRAEHDWRGRSVPSDPADATVECAKQKPGRDNLRYDCYFFSMHKPIYVSCVNHLQQNVRYDAWQLLWMGINWTINEHVRLKYALCAWKTDTKWKSYTR